MFEVSTPYYSTWFTTNYIMQIVDSHSSISFSFLASCILLQCSYVNLTCKHLELCWRSTGIFKEGHLTLAFQIQN